MTIANLILSIFPGIDLLGRAFEEEGFCVVRGPDLLWGGDIRRFHPPTGVFGGVIGGPPCQPWSVARNQTTNKAAAANLIPEFERVVAEAHPLWFLMEEVTAAPLPQVDGYHSQSHVLQDYEVGGRQLRRRRFTFGSRGLLLLWPSGEKAPRGELIRAAKEGRQPRALPTLTSTNTTLPIRGADRFRTPRGTTCFTWKEYCQGFGLPSDFDLPPFRQDEKFKALGNAVPLAMGRAIARAVKRAVYSERGSGL